MDLARKHVDRDIIESALQEGAAELIGGAGQDAPEDMVLEAGERQALEEFARKKRIGPYRPAPMPDDRGEAAKLWRREAAKMARAGFGVDLIREMMDRSPGEKDLID